MWHRCLRRKNTRVLLARHPTFCGYFYPYCVISRVKTHTSMLHFTLRVYYYVLYCRRYIVRDVLYDNDISHCARTDRCGRENRR